MDVVVDLVGKSGECVVEVVDGDRSWSSGFDLLAGDVDDLAADLERRMSQEVGGESPLAVLIRRRIAGARAKLRREVMAGGEGRGDA